ncbi:MAG TPA: tetratricopeptide repeat protein [Vicinamibacterales bacterium]|nr:tetratricopeptide repeat protein [Vicinamibacterales bacterium]
MARKRKPSSGASRTREIATEPIAARHRFLPLAIGGLLLAFLIKLIVVLQLKDHLLLQPDTTMDTGAYVGLAKRVVGGDAGLGPGLYYVSPLYIYFVAAILSVSQSLATIRIVQAVLATIGVAATFATARIWFGERAAWWAAGLTALTGVLAFYEAVILQAAIDPALTALALLALTLALTRAAPGWWVAAGACFAVQALNRPNMLIVAAALALATLLSIGRRASLLFAIGVTIGLAPIVLRNAVVAGQWAPVSSHGGLNFYIGNGPDATGLFRLVPGVRPTIEGQERDTRQVAERALGRSLSDSEVSSYFSGLAWEWIAGHPGQWLRLFVYKLWLVFNAQFIALPLSYPFYAYDARTLLRGLFVGPWMLVPLGVVGLAIARPWSDRRYLVWVAFVPAYAVSVAMFFVAERYRLPLLIPLAIGAGALIDRTVVALRNARTAAAAPALVAVACVGVLANWPLGFQDGDGRMEERVRMAENLARKGRAAEADRWLTLALEATPYPAQAHYRVGVQSAVAREWTSAVRHLSAAASLSPESAQISLALGQALLAAGRPDDAQTVLQRALPRVADLGADAQALAIALQSAGDPAGAAQALAAATPGPDEPVDAWLARGRSAIEIKAPAVALPFFEHAVRMAPESAAARQQLGLTLLLLGRHQDCVRELNAAVTLDAGNADSLGTLAYCELQLGRRDAARRHSDAALKLDPNQMIAAQVRAALGRRP